MGRLAFWIRRIWLARAINRLARDQTGGPRGFGGRIARASRHHTRRAELRRRAPYLRVLNRR